MKHVIWAAGLPLLMVMTVPVWKPVAKKSKWFIVGTNIYQDALRRLKVRSDQIGGEPEADAQLADLKHINRTFDRYMTYSGLTREALANKTVLEIGPGD